MRASGTGRRGHVPSSGEVQSKPHRRLTVCPSLPSRAAEYAAFLERGERPAVRGVGRAERRANGKRTGGTKKARERKADDSSSSTSSSGSEREEGEVRSRPARGEAVVCMGKACSKNGAEKLADTMRSEHGMSVKECGCMGKCKEGPNVVVGEGMAVDTNLLNAPLHPSHSP